MSLGDHNPFLAKGLAGGTRPLEAALHDFRRARQQAALEAITSRFTGRSLELLPFNQIAEMLGERGRSARGIQEIPLVAIVGSVGRYNDFTRSFLPRHDWDAQRWAGVKNAGHVYDLPPIEVYQIGAAYFVLDGNHRVSIARQLGLEYIHAHVTEVHTRVPISPNVQPDELIIKAEYAVFLDATRLDDLRPGCDLRVTVPGRYDRLENHIEVHRFFIEMATEQELSDEEAVTRWYDEAYLPLVRAIREQGILRDFPQRTETDLYLWLAEHQAQLRNALGWQIRPDTAVTQLAPQFKPKPLYRKVLDVVVPPGWKGRTQPDWAQERLLDRYSRSLFAEILLPVIGENCAALEQAITIAQRENGRIIGLILNPAGELAARKQVDGRCTETGVPIIWVRERGEPAEVISRRAALADLVILAKAEMGETAVNRLLQSCNRPILLLSGQPSRLEKLMLAHRRPGESALFAAAYLAEQWPVRLIVNATASLIQPARNYLEIHDVTAEFVTGERVAETAVTHACDLVVMGRDGRDLRQRLENLNLPVLICP
jgi:nucleotide-binding universal stress UspA family protein